MVRQPVSINFDERGRLWVVQYLQYPFPAGLRMVSHDGVWRAVYDKVPPAPPHHFRGKDKITIHEDTDGDGVFDRHKTFVDGLNIATAVAQGRGGVWVLNPPYLLFYPDRNRDDVPDGDPEVHLKGFGLEDTHSVVNSLRWGPDGWLYAAQGSTVTGHVTRPGLDDGKEPVHSMGQLIWRYHPETRRYEVFAEGGGNAFGVEIDAKGRIYSGHNGGDTRGFHYVQGAYLQKGFNKHGPLSNPYAFGYFPAMKHNRVPRFTHTFVFYEADAFPERYRGLLFGVAPLLNHVVTSDDPTGWLLVSNAGRRSGRVVVRPVVPARGYQARPRRCALHRRLVRPPGQSLPQPPGSNRAGQRADLSAPRKGDRAAAKSIGSGDPEHPRAGQTPGGFQQVDAPDGAAVDRRSEGPVARTSTPGTGREAEPVKIALEALWALNLVGGLDEATTLKTLDYPDPYVRLWTARLACDGSKVSSSFAASLARRAAIEPDVEVRSQLACSAKRLPARDALPIVRALLARGEDAGDIHIPLLLWWAIESKVGTDPEAVLAMFEDRTVWDLPIAKSMVLDRLMRRFAAAGTRPDLTRCARLLALAPGPDHVKRLMAGFESAYAGRSLAGLPPELVDALARYSGQSLTIGLRQGKPEAMTEALRSAGRRTRRSRQAAPAPPGPGRGAPAGLRAGRAPYRLRVAR